MDSGTWNVATPNGRVSAVMSTTNEAWRDSRHSLAMASETRKTKSRTRSLELGAQSPIVTPRIGNDVWPPQLGDMWSRLISGKFRFAAVGSLGPVSSFCRSTICSAPSPLVPYAKYTRLPTTIGPWTPWATVMGPVEPGCWPASPKSRTNTGFAGSLRS